MKINKTVKNLIYTLLSVFFWIAVWHIVSKNINLTLLLPSPAETLDTLVLKVQDPAFFKICAKSVFNIFKGAFIGILAGFVLAVAAFIIPVIRILISPPMTIIKATPVASFIVLLLILIGKESVPSITAAIISAPILYANVYASLEGIDKKLSEVCRVYSLSFIKRWHALWWPSVKPGIVAGIKSSVGLAWKAGIAAEVLCVPRDSLGEKIYDSKIYLETTELFAWTAVVIILSLLFEKLALCLIRERSKK